MVFKLYLHAVGFNTCVMLKDKKKKFNSKWWFLNCICSQAMLNYLPFCNYFSFHVNCSLSPASLNYEGYEGYVMFNVCLDTYS
jgi:hypothetical protein